MSAPRTAASRRRLRAELSAANKKPQTQPSEAPTETHERTVLSPITSQNVRPPIRSPVRDIQPIPWQGFAPRTPKKQHGFAFSPDASPQSTSSIASPRSTPSSPLAVDRSCERQISAFALEDADELDSKDQARHEISRALHGAERDELIRRCDARHIHRNPEMIAELEKRKAGWQRQQPRIPSRARSTPVMRDNGPRRTGAALLEYRRNQKAEIIARQLARHNGTKPAVVIDTTLADQTAVIVKRQATERVWMAKQREQRQNHRDPSTTSKTSMTRSVSNIMYETAGSEETGLSLAEMAIAEKERRHNEEVDWICSQMEDVLKRLQQDREMMEHEEGDTTHG
ncbi:hypothetical protein Q9L58_006113 [Maublancomyces gigas]|uniref:Uncharacterized protein n=1 Tax=Discina gigas TaxID=1032678 RepID=A0ABR3GG38_9PEZI